MGTLSAPFSYYARNSTAVHVVFILIAVIFSYVQGKFFEKRKRESMLLVKSSVRVDVVGMPRLTIKELKSAGIDVGMQVGKKMLADNLPPPTAKKDGAVLKLKKKFGSFKNMLASYAQKERVEKAVAPKRARKSSSVSRNKQKKLRQLITKGNLLSKGNSIVSNGQGKEAAGKLGEYASQFPDWIRPQWKLPGRLVDQNLQCRIRVFVSKTGKLLRTEIVASSGNDEYDKRAIRAIENSSPFEPPPDSVKRRILQGDIVLGFPL